MPKLSVTPIRNVPTTHAQIELRSNQTFRRRTLKKASSSVLFAFLVTIASAADYQITKKIPVPGQGSWDYLTVDEAARRLYVSHGTQVEVLDVDSGTLVGNIPNTPGVHCIAIAPEL